MTYLVGDSAQALGEEALIKEVKKSEQKQIKTTQMERLIGELAIQSPEVRVVILCDTLVSDGPNDVPAPYDWTVARPQAHFMPAPLRPGLLTAASANRFLKTLEEPPANTLILFLVRHESDILETLVSRCQVVPFQAQPGPVTALPEALQPFSEALLSGQPLFDTLHPLFESPGAIDWKTALSQLEQVWVQRTRSQWDNPQAFARSQQVLALLETARQRVVDTVSPQQALEDLCLSLSP
jgi:hypothetical protein